MVKSEKYLAMENDAKTALEGVLAELLEIRRVQAFDKPSGNIGWDPDMVLTVRQAGKQYTLLVMVKSSGTPGAIAEFAGKAKAWGTRLSGYPVLVAPLISSRGRELCKTLGLGFVDLSGNVFLKFNGILIEKWGKEGVAREKRLQKHLFSAKATWVIRRLLSEPERKWKFEELSTKADVSIGQAYKVVNKLVSEGYLEKERGSINLLRPGELLDAWAEIYRFDGQEISGYYCPLKDQDEIFKGLKSMQNYALTLGSAASLIAPFVRSTDVFIYVKNDIDKLIDALNLKPVEFGGNVYLVKPRDLAVFADAQTINGLITVSNIQLYLDLYNYPMRGREQAEHLREQVMGV
ncbi:MAG: type IV toxin-antitoxin system AbiEi family antitoxin [Thermoplasmata archaeon]|nr:type IV toxin-antitoxin system AbiEi family antitoxin [Thermoplasmata archaeon]